MKTVGVRAGWNHAAREQGHTHKLHRVTNAGKPGSRTKSLGSLQERSFGIDTDPEWRARIDAKNAGYREAWPRLADLEARLVGVAGRVVCLGFDEDLDAILTRGQSWGGKAQRMPGAPSQCHANSAACWEANRDHSRVATGYALSDDGMWRAHSWIVRPARGRSLATADPMQGEHWKIVETTVPRVAYHGFVLSEAECEKFLDENMF